MTINTKAPKRILIVDDQPHVLDVLRDIIARFQHGHAYEITTARSVADALNILQRERFDLILLDMRRVRNCSMFFRPSLPSWRFQMKSGRKTPSLDWARKADCLIASIESRSALHLIRHLGTN